MSTKYEASAFRRDAIKKLSELYPSPPHALPTNGNTTASPSSICMVITVSRESGAKTLLPMAYYYLAVKSLTDVFLARECDRLKILTGREKLKDKLCALLMNSYSKGCCRCSAKCLRNWNSFVHSDAQRELREELNVFSWDCERCPPGVCRRFKIDLEDYILTSRKSLWSELPSYFGLGTWQELKGTSDLGS